MADSMTVGRASRSSTRAAGLPGAAKALIGVTVVAGIACLAIRAAEVGRWGSSDLITLAALAAATSLLEFFPLPLYQRTEIVYFSLTDAVWAAGLLLARPGVLTLALAVGVAAAQSARGRAFVKVAFNVGQYLVAITAAQAIFTALRGDTILEPATLAAAALGMAAAFVVYCSATALVVSLVEGSPLRSVLFRSLGPDVLHAATNLALGLVAVILYLAAPGSLPMLAMPLLAMHSGYRSWLEPLQPGGVASRA